MHVSCFMFECCWNKAEGTRQKAQDSSFWILIAILIAIFILISSLPEYHEQVSALTHLQVNPDVLLKFIVFIWASVLTLEGPFRTLQGQLSRFLTFSPSHLLSSTNSFNNFPINSVHPWLKLLLAKSGLSTGKLPSPLCVSFNLVLSPSAYNSKVTDESPA